MIALKKSNRKTARFRTVNHVEYSKLLCKKWYRYVRPWKFTFIMRLYVLFYSVRNPFV